MYCCVCSVTHVCFCGVVALEHVGLCERLCDFSGPVIICVQMPACLCEAERVEMNGSL